MCVLEDEKKLMASLRAGQPVRLAAVDLKIATSRLRRILEKWVGLGYWEKPVGLLDGRLTTRGREVML
jgi:hypothetical protein